MITQQLTPAVKELHSLIEFAYSQRKYTQTLELIHQYLQLGTQPEGAAAMHLLAAKCHSELNQPSSCLQHLGLAAGLGHRTQEVSLLRIRALIQLSLIKEAEQEMASLLAANQELRQVVHLSKAIALIKDEFEGHRVSSDEEAILQAMHKWLYQAGATYDKIKIVNVHPGYRGAIAVRHIRKKEPIVYIPRSELITLEQAKANRFSQKILECKARLESPKHTFLSILLLELRKGGSKFQPYIDLLPQDHTCFPINYSKQQLEMLEGSPFLNMILEKVVELKKDYDTVGRTDVTFAQLYSFKQFCWARMMVCSRLFGILVDGVKTAVLVPFADMLNHRQPKQTVWNYDHSMNGFVIESLEDIEVGQEVFDSYGRKCNSRYLLNYGFIEDNNPDNEIALRVVIPASDKLFRAKMEMIKHGSNEPYVEIRKITLNLNNNRFFELMGILRFLCVEEEQTLNTLKKISGVEKSGEPYCMTRTPPISLPNQKLIWLQLGRLCEERLALYPGSLEQDRQQLGSPQLTQNQRNIIGLRMGEKHILHEYVRIIQEVSKILNSENVIVALGGSLGAVYARYLYKILSILPGINRKALEKALGHHFAASSEEPPQEELEEVAQY